MKRIAAVLLLLASVSIFAAPASAQRQGVSTNDHVAATVQRASPPPALDSTIQIGPNMVDIVGRHCQKYMRDGVIDNTACAADSTTVYYRHRDHNLLTNAGKDVIASAVSNTATQAAACNYIAVTNTAITPGVTDTTLSGEIAVNGLARAQAVYAHSNGTSTYTLTKVFNASNTQASQAAGVFNASSVGSMCFENTYTAVTVNNGDTLTVTWTITMSKLQLPGNLLLFPQRLPMFELATAA